MKKIILLLLFVVPSMKYLQSQNVGIGTTTPTGPLSFKSILGNKIVLWGDGNLAHYGLGIQSGLLQLYSDAFAANIAFGYGSSTSFTERMRIINAGGDGMSLNGRITLRNGTSPLDLNYGSGVWLYKADNTAPLGFMGVQNNQNIGFYGGPGGWGFTYNALNSRVGIGNNNPNAPLSFAPSLGKKITLYPGATGDVGFGVAGNRLQIYSDNPNADVAIGYDAAGTFNERFAVKPTGALAVMGNAGTAGQTLTSNGAGSAATWTSATNQLFNGTYSFGLSGALLTTGNGVAYDLAGLNQDIVLTQTSKVLVAIHVAGYNNGCFGCGDAVMEFRLYIDNPSVTNYFQYKSTHTANGSSFNEDSGFRLVTLGPGTHNFKMTAQHNTGGDVNVYPDTQPFGTRMMIVVLPQ